MESILEENKGIENAAHRQGNGVKRSGTEFPCLR